MGTGRIFEVRHLPRRLAALAAALACLAAASPSTAGHDAEQMLRDRCAADWPEDLEKQQACATDHMEAALRYLAGRRATESGTPERDVYVRCFDESTGAEGTDWLEAEDCVNQGLKARGESPPD